MAKAIATITGTALTPGVSRNKRLYTRENIRKMVARASERITAGKRPIAMYTSHDSTDVADVGGVLTSIWQEADGRARYTAEVPDTPAGRTVAALADTSSGTTFLRNVSILGNWVGGERAGTGPGGEAVTTGQDFELARLDFVTSPGVDGADIDFLEAVAAGEAALDYSIAESAPEALVTVAETGTQPVAENAAEGTSEAAPEVGNDVREAVRAVFAPAEAHVLENGLCVTCGGVEEAKRTRNTKPYGDVPYADPGYLDANGKQASSSGKPGIKRYPLDKKHIRAAWSYINQARSAAQYTAGQLKRIKSRIKAAMRSIGAKVSAESDVVAGFVIGEAVAAPGAIVEWLGEDPGRSGSWSISASNGPVNLSISSYGMDPADLEVILRAAATAATAAFKALDPDMDGDVDVAGDSGDQDYDNDGGHETEPEPEAPAAENAPASETSEAAAGPGETPAPEREPDKETEAPVTTEATTNPGGSAPSTITEADMQKAIAEALEADRKARKERKAAKKAKEAAPAAPVAESAPPAEPGDLKAAMAEVLESYGLKPPVKETEEERVNRLVQEGVTKFVQEAVSTGAVIPGRAGLQVREHAPTPEEALDVKGLAAMSDDDFLAYGGAALDKYVGDNTRHDSLHT